MPKNAEFGIKGDRMRWVCHIGDAWAYLEICAYEDERRIVVNVECYGLGTPIVERYSPDLYGKALDRFNELQELMRERAENGQRDS